MSIDATRYDKDQSKGNHEDKGFKKEDQAA
jgi:hypothetical protein